MFAMCGYQFAPRHADISDTQLRCCRMIGAQVNVGESRHTLARWVFFDLGLAGGGVGTCPVHMRATRAARRRHLCLGAEIDVPERDPRCVVVIEC